MVRDREVICRFTPRGPLLTDVAALRLVRGSANQAGPYSRHERRISSRSRWIAFLGVTIAAGMPYAAAVFGQTPEETKAWEAQRAESHAEEKIKAERLAQLRAVRKADPMAWVKTLDPMSAGGWTFRAVANDGSWAVFSTDHQMKRSGRLVTIWLRQEYPEPQKGSGADAYWSDVERLQFDCAKEQVRVLLAIYYSENNLAGSQQSEQADLKNTVWDPVVPGTQSELVFHWACAADNSKTNP